MSSDQEITNYLSPTSRKDNDSRFQTMESSKEISLFEKKNQTTSVKSSPQKNELNRKNIEKEAESLKSSKDSKRTTDEHKNKIKGFFKKLLKPKEEKNQGSLQAEKERKEQQIEIEALCEQLEMQKEIIKQLTWEHEHLKRMNMSSEEMINFQKEGLRKKDEKINEITETTEKKIRFLGEENSKKSIELRDLKEKFENLEQEHEKIQKIADVLKMDNLILRQKLEDTAKNDQCARQLGYSNRKIEELTELREHLVAKTKEYEEEKEKYRQKAKHLEGKLEEKKEKCKNLISEISIASEREERLLARIQKKKKKIVCLKNQLERSENNVKLIKEESMRNEEKNNKILCSLGIKKTIENEDSEEKKEVPYDIVINIDSLKTRFRGWKVIIDQKVNFERFFGEKYTKVGIVGRENIGKTFILNKLCGFDLPTGSNIHTKGLSIKVGKNGDFVCFDSAGMQTPVYYYDKKTLERFGTTRESINENPELLREMINDRTVTDIFIQDFILEICDIIVIVVGHLSQNDQKLIERIKSKYKTKKRIIIVHNYNDIYTLRDVEKKARKDIVKAFDTVKRCIPDSDCWEYVEKAAVKEKENISHLTLGVDWAESGQVLNMATLGYLRKILETCTERKKFDLITELTEFFEENYRLYLQFKKKPIECVTLKYSQKESRVYIKTDSDYEVSNPVFNSLGALIVNPSFEIIEKPNFLLVLIEVSDVDENSLQFFFEKKKSEFCCLVVKGVKLESEYSNQEDNKRVVSLRKCGEFVGVFPLGPYYADLIVEKWGYERGILEVKVRDKTSEIIEL